MGRPCPVSRARSWFVSPGQLVSLSSPHLGNHQGRDSAVHGKNSNRWKVDWWVVSYIDNKLWLLWRLGMILSAHSRWDLEKLIRFQVIFAQKFPACIRVSKKMLSSGIQIVRLSRCNLLSKTLSGAELRGWYRNLCGVPGDQFTNNSSPPPPCLTPAALMWWNFNGNNLGGEEEIGGISSPETMLWPQQMCPVFIDKSLCWCWWWPHAALVHHTQSPWPPPPGGEGGHCYSVTRHIPVRWQSSGANNGGL